MAGRSKPADHHAPKSRGRRRASWTLPRLSVVRAAVYRTLDPRHHSRAADAFRVVHHVLGVVGTVTVILSPVPQFPARYEERLAFGLNVALPFLPAARGLAS